MAAAKPLKTLHWTLEGLDEAQKQAVEELRESLRQSGELVGGFFGQDATLARFLVARGFQVNKAHQMYVDSTHWRKEYGADEVLEAFDFEEKDEVMQIFPHFHHKLDKSGHPIFFQQLGCKDFGEVLKLTTVERLVRYHVQIWEGVVVHKFPSASKVAGREIFTVTAVVDVKDAKIKDFFRYKELRTLIKEMTVIDQDNYPEFMGSLFLINTPLPFRAVWKVVKGWMDRRTQEKITVLGSSFQEELFKVCPPDSVPECFGGTCTCANLGGCAFSNAGPWLDASIRPSHIEGESYSLYPTDRALSRRFVYTMRGKDFTVDEEGHPHGISDWGEAVVDDEGNIFVDAMEYNGVEKHSRNSR